MKNITTFDWLRRQFNLSFYDIIEEYYKLMCKLNAWDHERINGSVIFKDNNGNVKFVNNLSNYPFIAYDGSIYYLFYYNVFWRYELDLYNNTGSEGQATLISQPDKLYMDDFIIYYVEGDYERCIKRLKNRLYVAKYVKIRFGNYLRYVDYHKDKNTFSLKCSCSKNSTTCPAWHNIENVDEGLLRNVVSVRASTDGYWRL